MFFARNDADFSASFDERSFDLVGRQDLPFLAEFFQKIFASKVAGFHRLALHLAVFNDEPFGTFEEGIDASRPKGEGSATLVNQNKDDGRAQRWEERSRSIHSAGEHGRENEPKDNVEGAHFGEKSFIARTHDEDSCEEDNDNATRQMHKAQVPCFQP